MPFGAARLALFAKPQVEAVAEVIRRKVGVSALGNAQVDTAQSKFGGSSYVGASAGDYVILQDTETSLSVGSGNDITIECWARPTFTSANRTIMSKTPSSGNLTEWLLWTDTSNHFQFYIFAGAGSILNLISTTTYSTNNWYHIAVVNNSNTWTLYVDGVAEATNTVSSYTGVSNTYKAILGRMPGYSTRDWYGNIDEVRISNTARYTTSFTPSTTPFTNDDNTLLLLHMDGTDGSTLFEDDNGVREPLNARSINGMSLTTSASKFGSSSAYFEGTATSTYLSLIGGASGTVYDWLNLDHSDDFTFEAWIYINDLSYLQSIIGHRSGTTGWQFVVRSDTQILQLWNINGSNQILDGTTALSTSTWYHIALVRSGGDWTIWLNGSDDGNYSPSLQPASTGNPTLIGADSTNGGRDFNGYMDEVRISDIARYTTSFTPSTAPFVNDANTLLLLHMDGTDGSTDFRDDNGYHTAGRTAVHVSPQGNAQVDTAQSKFGGASLLLDGTGDYLLHPRNDLFAYGTGDFTIECWARLDVTTFKIVINNRYGGSTIEENSVVVAINSGKFAFSNGQSWLNTTTTLNTGEWYHYAVSRENGTLRQFVNGTKEYEGTFSTDLTSPRYFIVGAFEDNTYNFDGNIDELRVSNTARYTANFTPSTEPFSNDANTLLLLHMDGADGSTTFTDDVGGRSAVGVSALGNAQIDTAQYKFGGASLLLDGTGDYLRIDETSTLAFGDDDWTVECWARFDTLSSNRIVIDTRPSGATGPYPTIYTSGTTLYYFVGGNDFLNGGTLSTGTWYHIAVVRSSGTVTLYLDGVSKDSNTHTATYGAGSPTTIGASSYALGNGALDGNIDEVRISNIARYTSSFTPSTEPFSNDANTLVLLHMDGTDGSTTFIDDNGKVA